MDGEREATIELNVPLDRMAMSSWFPSFVPEYLCVSYHKLTKDNDHWHKTIEYHRLNNNITVHEVPASVEVRILTTFQYRTQNRNTLIAQVSIIQHNNNTCVNESTEEDTCGNVFDKLGFSMATQPVHNFYHKRSYNEICNDDSFRCHEFHVFCFTSSYIPVFTNS